MEQDREKRLERKPQLDLLDRASIEHDAASQLLLSGGIDQGSAAALHLFRGWHAVATVQSRLSGGSDPDFDSFSVDDDSEILAVVPKNKITAWANSFTKVREAALARPWYREASRPDLKDLRLQTRLLARCISAQRRRVVASTVGGRGVRIRWHHVLTAIAAVVLAFAAVDLGGRLIRSVKMRAEVKRQMRIAPADQEVDLNAVRDFKPRGSAWDGAGNIVFRRSVAIHLGGTRYPDTLSVSLDGNDLYTLRFVADEKIVSMLSVGLSSVDGLEVYSVSVPEDARDRGFDRIVIEVDEGDGFHSLGHLLLNEPAHSGTQDEMP